MKALKDTVIRIIHLFNHLDQTIKLKIIVQVSQQRIIV